MKTDDLPRIEPADSLRPDLRVPLLATARIEATLARLSEPRFADAHRRTLRALAGAAALTAAQFAVVPSLRPWLLGAAALLLLDLVCRLLALNSLRRRQRAFEPRWLEAQSAVLRTASFEVVRFEVSTPFERRPRGRAQSYDLTRPAEVEMLIERQRDDRARGRSSQVKLEFSYLLGPARRAAIEVVHLDLDDVTIVRAEGARRARVRFPEARYHAQPSLHRTGWRQPSETTFWVLGPATVHAAAG
ncbi:hypothetical protein [Amycolatopsis orientalis]|uniref:hypothetical protein n=1 Tax=Amycolatopsis orientalis TaxID=31958 RepID=UPI00040E9EF8|nr:hypothetical protein [Amycolatopsis orientalis]